MAILQFNFFVMTVKYLCNGRCRIGCVLSLQCNCNFLSSFRMFCNQNSHSIQTNSHKIQTEIFNGVIEYLTLQMLGSTVPQPCKMQGFRISVKTCECKGFRDCLRIACKQLLHFEYSLSIFAPVHYCPTHMQAVPM